MGRARRKPSRVSPKKNKRVTSTGRSSAIKRAFAQNDDVEQTKPRTETEWNQMEQAEELVTTKHRYRKGCDVLVNSNDGPNNTWIGRVRSIRRRKPPGGEEVWLLVQWYYSANDIGAVKGLKLSEALLDSLHENERVLSDVLDFISANTLNGLTHVYRYDEEAVDPPEIDSTREYFVRYDLKDTHSAAPKIIPYPGQYTCICHLPYNPFPEEVQVLRAATEQFYKRHSKSPRDKPSNIERAGDYMHFCPRPACSTWFHESCLLEPIDEAAFIATPDVRRLAVDPDRNELYPQLARYAYEKPARGKGAHGAPRALHDIDVLGAAASLLPAALLAVAALPILRRAGDGPFATAGNVADVVLARRLVYQALDGWHGELDRVVKRLDESWYSGEGGGDVYNFVWWFLNSQRILASPRVRYWDELLEKLEVHSGRPVLHCPKCREADLLVSI